MQSRKNSNLTFKYGKDPKETLSRIYPIRVIKTVCKRQALSAGKYKASDAVHNSFWTLKQGLIAKL